MQRSASRNDSASPTSASWPSATCRRSRRSERCSGQGHRSWRWRIGSAEHRWLGPDQRSVVPDRDGYDPHALQRSLRLL